MNDVLISKDIVINARSKYINDKSSIDNSVYFFSYNVIIKNVY